jgi:hypothetical protein
VTLWPRLAEVAHTARVADAPTAEDAWENVARAVVSAYQDAPEVRAATATSAPAAASRELGTLERMLLLGRQHGATRLRCGDLEVVLGPAPTVAPPPEVATQPPTIPEADLCACSCPMDEHTGEGLCANGCDPSACLKAPPPLPM